MTPDRLRYARLHASLTQKQAAHLVGVALRTYQAWEYGTRQMSAPVWELFCIKLERMKNGNV